MVKHPVNGKYRFTLGSASYVILKLVNVIGIEVATLLSGTKQPGSYEVKYDGIKCPAGIYYYKLFTDSPSENLSEFVSLPECPEKRLRLIDTKEVLIL